MLMLLGWRLVWFLGLADHALSWPYELDYGEGIVWQQAKTLFSSAAYGPIDGFPSIVFHYTPLYHGAAVAASDVFGVDLLYAGRAISIASLLVSALAIGALAMRASASGRVAAAIAGLGGGLIVFTLYPAVYWAPMMRVDMVAFALCLTGFWFGVRAVERPVLIHAAAVCFVAAIFAKQTSIAAPAALFLLLAGLRSRLALTLFASCVALGLIALGGMQWATGGGFFRHVFLYNINRFEPARLWQIVSALSLHGPIFVVALIMTAWRLASLAAIYRKLPKGAILDNRADFTFVAVLVYAGIATLGTLMIAKSGSNVNYLIEWLFVVAVLAGVGLGDAARLALGEADDAPKDVRLMLGVIGVPLALAAQAWLIKPERFDVYWNKSRVPQLEALSARVKATDKPIISDDMVMLLRSGKDVVWEPAIFAELASKGVWDEAPFVERVRRCEFAMFITVGKRGQRLFDSRYNPAVADAMDAAYPIKESAAGYTLHLPKSGSAPSCAGNPSKPT